MTVAAAIYLLRSQVRRTALWDTCWWESGGSQDGAEILISIGFSSGR